MVMISDRPPDADGRAVPGHREGDLIVLPKPSPGTRGKEMAKHACFIIDTGIQIYFRHPQRGLAAALQ